MISIYWSFRGTNVDIRPSGKVLWDRFPKFVPLSSLRWYLAAFDAETGKVLSKVANGGARNLSSRAFVCIGLETDFRYIFKKENARYIWSFLTAQCFNIIVTLIVAWLLFAYFF